MMRPKLFTVSAWDRDGVGKSVLSHTNNVKMAFRAKSIEDLTFDGHLALYGWLEN
jgi:hypothetical protein